MDHCGIRYIDNFSTGRRGARIAEAFLREDYVVILLAREGSCLPFLMDVIYKGGECKTLNYFGLTDDGKIIYNPPKDKHITAMAAISDNLKYKEKLFFVPYIYAEEYGQKLRTISTVCRNLGSRVAFCLAAAVSDFGISPEEMPKQKQSCEIKTLRLVPLPKYRDIVREICGQPPLLCCFKLLTEDTPETEKKIREMFTPPTLADLVITNKLSERYIRVNVEYPDRSIRVLRSAECDIDKTIPTLISEAHTDKILRYS